jgi:glycerate kinase
MKIVLAVDSFKGTFSSAEIIEVVDSAIKRIMGENEILKVPVADGGEGTVEAFTIATNGVLKQTMAPNAFGELKTVEYGIIHGDTAVIEMANIAGLMTKKDPLKASSAGLGVVISHVLNQGYKKMIIGIGGSGTNDGGMGMLTALGAKFYAKGKQLPGQGKDLIVVDEIDLSGLDKRLEEADISVVCDVTNPLLGEHGATYVYGPQKGAVGEIADRMEAGMKNYADLFLKTCGIDITTEKGAGAAGGVGAALGCVLGAKMNVGIETILDIVGFDRMLDDVDLVITGEGKLDYQSVRYGKGPIGIAKVCGHKNIPVAMIVGSLGEGWEGVYDIAKCSIFTAIDAPMTLDYAIENARRLLISACDRMIRFIDLLR